MRQKNAEMLLYHGKFKQTYKEGAKELLKTTDFEATNVNPRLVSKLQIDLTATAKVKAPPNILPHLHEVVDVCAKYLAQHAEYSKDKGEAFQQLVKSMKARGDEVLYNTGKRRSTYVKAAIELEEAKGLQGKTRSESLSKDIHTKLENLVKPTTSETPPESDMKETLNIAANYLAHKATGYVDRGPAFELLMKTLDDNGSERFTPEFPYLDTKENAAYVLKTAPDLKVTKTDPEAAKVFSDKLHETVDQVTPAHLKDKMKDAIDDSSNYLSNAIHVEGKLKGILEDRDKAGRRNGEAGVHANKGPVFDFLVKTLEDKGSEKFTPEFPYLDTKENAAYILKSASDLKVTKTDPEAAKVFSDKLHETVDKVTPADMKDKMKGTIDECSGYLSNAIKDEAKLKKLIEEKDKYGPDGKSSKAGILEKANKDPAFDILVKTLEDKGSDKFAPEFPYLDTKENAAYILKTASDLKVTNTDSKAAKVFSDKLHETVEHATPAHLKEKMKDIVDICSGYLSSAIKNEGKLKAKLEDRDKNAGTKGADSKSGSNGKADKGPVFDLLVKTLQDKGAETFTPEFPYLDTKENAAHVLKNASALKVSNPDPKAVKVFSDKLHETVDQVTPADMKDKMKGTINECSGYLSSAIKDEAKLKALIEKKDKEGKGARGASSKGDKGAGGVGGSASGSAGESGSASASAGIKEKHVPGDLEGKDRGSDKRLRDEGMSGREGVDMRAKVEAERQEAMKILKSKLQSRGGDVLHNQAPTSITYSDASKVISRDAYTTVRGTADTKRLASKVERKLSDLVKKDTPREIEEAMQDAVIESSQRISEYVIAKNYKMQAREVLVAELQKGGNEVLIELNGVAETAFFAAQRLKMAKSLNTTDANDQISHFLTRRIEEVIRCQPVPRKLLGVMKEHIRDASDYLSKIVTKQDPYIECYVILLREMDEAGNKVLVRGTITKTCKESADYLKQLVSFNDEINKSNGSIQTQIESEMNNLVNKLHESSFNKSVMSGVIRDNAKLLTSYITLQELKTNALKALVEIMRKEDVCKILLRHGTVCKTYMDAVTVLHDKTIDKISVTGADAVAMRKIELKLNNLIADKPKIPYMDEVIDEITMYLAVRLLQPITRRICKCKRNVLVQCELWCDDILRKITIPCNCCPNENINEEPIRICPSKQSPNLGVRVKPCPTFDNKSCPSQKPKCTSYVLFVSKPKKFENKISPKGSLIRDVYGNVGPAVSKHNQSASSTDLAKSIYNPTNTLMATGIECDYYNKHIRRPHTSYGMKSSTTFKSDLDWICKRRKHNIKKSNTTVAEVECGAYRTRRANPNYIKISSTEAELEFGKYITRKSNNSSIKRSNTTMTSEVGYTKVLRPKSDYMTKSYSKIETEFEVSKARRPNSSYNKRYAQNSDCHSKTTRNNTSMTDAVECAFKTPKPKSNCNKSSKATMTAEEYNTVKRYRHNAKSNTIMTTEMDIKAFKTHRSKNYMERSYTTMIAEVGYNTSKTRRDNSSHSRNQGVEFARCSIASSNVMSDWHAVLISVIWNVHAWRVWIQDSVDGVFNLKLPQREKWGTFKKRMITEVEKWCQYNRFSQRLTQILSEKYQNTLQKSSVKTEEFRECQRDIEDIVNMSQRWILWLSSIINEGNSSEQGKNVKMIIEDLKWKQFNTKVKEFLNVWFKYDVRLKLYLNQKYGNLISGYLSKWDEPGPVWVMSACGAVPSGAVAAGVSDEEVIWVARTSHNCNVLPAALCPSKHHCLVYYNGSMHCYTKYEVLCNANVIWRSWKAGRINSQAVEVTSDVYIGRIQFHGSHIIGSVHGPSYRCHVTIYNKPFTFNCYELLVLVNSDV